MPGGFAIHKLVELLPLRQRARSWFAENRTVINGISSHGVAL
jgi:hypothetical protein